MFQSLSLSDVLVETRRVVFSNDRLQNKQFRYAVCEATLAMPHLIMNLTCFVMSNVIIL